MTRARVSQALRAHSHDRRLAQGTPWGSSGAYEQAVLNTKLVESNAVDAASFKGVDILRAIRSFDPCMPCMTHLMVEGSDRVITREVTTCACGI